jgi:hypothetical protein
MSTVEQEIGHKPRVYIIEQQAFDYSPATVFGIPFFMNFQPLAPAGGGAPESWNQISMHQARKELAEYVPGMDYIVPTGKPAKMLAVGMLLAEKGKRHRVLGWDARTQRYLEFIINV